MGTNYCTECGAEIKPGDRFCQECGTTVIEGHGYISEDNEVKKNSTAEEIQTEENVEEVEEEDFDTSRGDYYVSDNTSFEERKEFDPFSQNVDAKTTAYSEHTNKTKNILIVSIIALLIIIGIFLLFI